MNRLRHKINDTECGVCKNIFHPTHYKIKHCSRKCANASRKGKPTWNKGIKGYMAGEKHHWYGRNNKGENNPYYKKDRTLLKRFNDDSKDRRSSAYVTWRNEVYKRDNWKCKINNKDCNGRLEAHHILEYAEHPELRYEINNGITLCQAHHPRKRAEEKRLSPYFMELVSVSNK